jgi:hypothetical protein
LDGRGCTFCDEPAAYNFWNRETGSKGEMCKEHRDALDVREPARFGRVPGSKPEVMARLGPETIGAFNRGNLVGRRIPEQTVQRGDGPSLVSDERQRQSDRLREKKLGREWERTIEEDPWKRLAREAERRDPGDRL